ncbi:MAG TPA: kelch repeat-containing protein [Pyrinomonadaceae bacterium]|nr:kelch repeat-containing protein [Pyrinomonadaceae bacterium]
MSFEGAKSLFGFGHCRPLLSPYIDGELDARRRGAVEEHLDGCAACRAECEELRRASALASSLRLPDAAPAAFPLRLKRQAPSASAPPAWGRRPVLASAAALLLVALAAGAWYYARGPRGAWEVKRLAGSPTLGERRLEEAGRMRVGEWLETDRFSRALISVGAIGQVEVDASTRVGLSEARPSEHRLTLARGRVRAAITAPPRLFFIETPSAVAVDYGCAYTLEVDEAGAGLLHVTAGWVGLVLDGRESLVPAGAMCRSKPGAGPGTPFLEDASEALREALDAFDFRGGGDQALGVVLAEARPKDSLTLWHLLSRTKGDARARVFGRLAALVPPPEGVTCEAAPRVEEGPMLRWRERIELASVGADYASAPAAPGKVVSAGLMREARFAHAATALAGGQVLITGGLERMESPLASAELYDPASGAFTPVGTMSARRIGHTATLLADGRVLITGGSDDTFYTGALPSAELYDPSTRAFTPAPDMQAARLAHRATLLPDGRVLITGGQDEAGRKLSSAEIYNPAANAFTPIGDMNSPRSDHAATLLADGRVLITGGAAGGQPGEGPVASAELYDPARGAFVPTGSMHAVRYKHSATLLPDGRVIVIGGSDARMWAGRFATAEVYDPATGLFTPTGSMTTARYKIRDAVVPLEGGRVLVAGGGPRVEIYDPATGLFGLVEGDLGETRFYSTATPLPGGRVLIAGGYLAGNRATMYADRSAWIYEP